MIESIEISISIMQKMENLKIRPDEPPIEVIARALDIPGDDDYIDEETETAIIKGMEEYKAGKSISHEELGKKIRFYLMYSLKYSHHAKREIKNLDPTVGK